MLAQVLPLKFPIPPSTAELHNAALLRALLLMLTASAAATAAASQCRQNWVGIREQVEVGSSPWTVLGHSRDMQWPGCAHT